jgi:hypothetical protein
MARRAEPVVVFTEPLRRVVDVLSALFAKVESLCVVALLLEAAGHTVTNAATGVGTPLTGTRTEVDLEDAGIDSVRLVVRGKNSTAGSVTVQLYNRTQSAAMATVTLTGTSEQTADSGWQSFTPNGGDEEIEIRVIGDGAMDPVLYAAHFHGRTVQARA